MIDIKNLVRNNIVKLTAYSSARDEFSGRDAILLDANESPYNSPLNRYPDPHQRELKLKLSDMLGISEKQLFLGNGSDEAIDLIIRIFCTPGADRLIIMDPSYGMYKVCADVNDVAADFVLLKDDFGLDSKKVLDAVKEETKIIFLCSPNNPSANSLDSEEVISILKNFRGIVVIDEAYIDFSNEMGFLNRLAMHNNLVILRTLSKAWGLAGIRLGMAIADEYIISLLDKIKYPYNVNILTQEKALESLREPQRKEEWVDRILSERTRIEKALQNFSMIEKIHPSDANFLLVKMKDPGRVYHYLAEHMVIVRNRSNVSLCEGSLRITIGTADENNAMLELLGHYSSENMTQ